MILTILKIIVLAIASWIMVHVLVVFGLFLSLLYPLWWLFSSKRLPCFVCRINKTYDCRFRHAFVTSLGILIISVASTGLIFVEGNMLKYVGFSHVPKNVSLVIPTKGQYSVGEVFPMKITVSNLKVPINTVQADISFDPKKLAIVDISTANSFATIFIQKTINNFSGYARLTGGLPNPGFFKTKGTFATVIFQGKTPGPVKVTFLPTSMVLANDKIGTEVLKTFPTVNYLIVPATQKVSRAKDMSYVLGSEMQNGSQLTYFDNDSKSVLGAQAPIQNLTPPSSFFSSLFAGIQKFDSSIVGFWKNTATIFWSK